MPERVTGFALIENLQVKEFYILKKGEELEPIIRYRSDEKPYQYTTKSELIADLVLILKERGYYVTHTKSVGKDHYYYDIYIKDISGNDDAFKKYPCKIAVRGAMRPNKKEEK